MENCLPGQASLCCSSLTNYLRLVYFGLSPGGYVCMSNVTQELDTKEEKLPCILAVAGEKLVRLSEPETDIVLIEDVNQHSHVQQTVYLDSLIAMWHQLQTTDIRFSNGGGTQLATSSRHTLDRFDHIRGQLVLLKTKVEQYEKNLGSNGAIEMPAPTQHHGIHDRGQDFATKCLKTSFDMLVEMIELKSLLNDCYMAYYKALTGKEQLMIQLRYQASLDASDGEPINSHPDEKIGARLIKWIYKRLFNKDIGSTS